MLNIINKYKMKVCFSTGVKYKNIYYLTAIHMNALFSYDEENDKLTYLMSFDQEKKNSFLYLKSFLYQNEAWFIPYQADYIAIVNLEKLSVTYMPLLFKKRYTDISIKYINVLFFYNDFLCLLPVGVDAIMIIDLKKKKAKAYYEVVDKNVNYNSAINVDKKIYCFPWKGENILILDWKTDEIKYMPWIKEDEAFGDAVYDEKSKKLFHAPAKKNYILIDDLNSKIYEKKEVGNWNDDKYKTYYSTYYKNEIFFWGHEKGIVLRINKDDYKIEKYIINQADKECYFYPICSEQVEAIVFDGNCIIKYDEDNDCFIKKYVNTNFEDILQETEKVGSDIKEISWTSEKNSWTENDEFGIKYFIYCCDKKECKFQRNNINVGNKIYRNVQEMIYKIN